MTDISKERRAFLREGIEGEPDDRNLSGWGLAVSIGELRALLDAADERDRLREAARNWLASHEAPFDRHVHVGAAEEALATEVRRTPDDLARIDRISRAMDLNRLRLRSDPDAPL